MLYKYVIANSTKLQELNRQKKRMINTFLNDNDSPKLSENIGKLLLVLSIVLLCIISLTMFQDFLESRINGYSFYFSESILFKTIWFLYIPTILILHKILKNRNLDNYSKASVLIVFAIAVHLLFIPLVGVLFSVLFYEGRYDLYKFFSYTLAHDLYKLVIVYTSFVLGYNYISNRPRNIAIQQALPILDILVINNGKVNTIVNVEDIVQITSATPYIFIHLENKQYLHSETLKSICKQLNNKTFVRVHKSRVVNISKVSSFKSRLNGDYDLQLVNGDLVRLSRTYATDFKNRFNASQRVTV